MDSFALRQEQSELFKSVSGLKHTLEVGEARIKELHDEEMRYLKEIPVYRQQSSEGRLEAKDLSSKIDIMKKEALVLKQSLYEIQNSVSKENEALDSLKETQIKIIEETKEINNQISNRHNDLMNRESSVQVRESNVSLKEKFCDNKESELSNREAELSKKENEHNNNVVILNSDIEKHELNVNAHDENVKSFAERKRFQYEDEQLLRDKLAKADKLVKDQVGLKAALLLQSEKLSKEISLTQAKQVSLEKNIADLINQENALKIKELKLNKMVHDAGLAKELAELSK